VVERVLRRVGADISEERKRFDMPILVSGVVRHVHVTLANGLTFNFSEMYCLLFWVALDDLYNREAINCK